MRPNSAPTFQHGVTLLEVLIAVVVLSFGLLAMLGLLLNGLKMTSSSNYRSIAAQQLVAIADMVNANPYLIAGYSPPGAVSGSIYCFTANCAATALPPADFDRWQLNVASSLPNGSGTLCLDDTPEDGKSGAFACSNTGRPTAKICWNENARIAISGGGGSRNDSTINETCLVSQL